MFLVVDIKPTSNGGGTFAGSHKRNVVAVDVHFPQTVVVKNVVLARAQLNVEGGSFCVFFLPREHQCDVHRVLYSRTVVRHSNGVALHDFLPMLVKKSVAAA